MKRGLLFSLMTLFLLISLLLFTQAFFSRAVAANDIRVQLPGPARDRVLAFAITEDLMAIHGAKVPTINRTSTHLTVTFPTAGTLGQRNLSARIQAYAAYVNTSYTTAAHANISLFVGSFNITIPGYNTTLIFGENSTRVYTQRANEIRHINVTIRIGEASLDNTSWPSSGTSFQNVTVIFVNASGSIILSRHTTLSPNATNLPFDAFFDGGTRRVSVEFGLFDGRPGTLRINATRINATPQDLKMKYTLYPSGLSIAANARLAIGTTNASVLIAEG